MCGPKVKFYTLLIYLCRSNSFSLTLENTNLFTQFHFSLGVINYSKAIDAVGDFKNHEGVRYFKWLKITIFGVLPHTVFPDPLALLLTPCNAIENWNKCILTFFYLPFKTRQYLYSP